MNKEAHFSYYPILFYPLLPTTSAHILSSTPGGTSISLLIAFTAWSFVNLSKASSSIAQQTQVSWVKHTAFKSRGNPDTNEHFLLIFHWRMWSAESRRDNVCCVVVVITMPCPTLAFSPPNSLVETSLRSAKFHTCLQTQAQNTSSPTAAKSAEPNMSCVSSPLHQKKRRP